MVSLHTSRRGFSLLEMSIVMVIIAAVVASGAMMGQSTIDTARKVSTNNKLDAIEAALMAYRQAYNRLPCPGDATLTDSAANAATYGVEAANKGSCTGSLPAANASYTLGVNSNTSSPVLSGSVVVEGAVPVRTLGLPDEFQLDGWGRKIAYAVPAPYTASNAFVTYGISPSCGAITVENAAHGYRTQTAVYALVSYGPDGHGGYVKTGTRFNGKSTNADEDVNAHYNSSGSDTGYAAIYIQKDWTQDPASSTNGFNNIVRYKQRWQMQNAADGYSPTGASCSPGFRIDGTTAASRYMGNKIVIGDVNGDGIPDLIIGMPGCNKSTNCSNTAYTFVIFGTKSGFPDPLSVTTLDGTNGFVLQSTSAFGGAATAVADFNGDGFSDLIVSGANALNSGGGKYYVVFGGPKMKDGVHAWTTCAYATPCTMDNTGAATSLINGTNAIEIDGGQNGMAVGWSLAVGDFNGDGYADIATGGGSRFTAAPKSSVFILFGGTAMKSGTAWSTCVPNTCKFNFTGAVGGTLADGTNGLEFDNTAAGVFMGVGTAMGDFNGDGYTDLVTSTFTNKVFIVFGGTKMRDGTAWSTCAAGVSPASGSCVYDNAGGHIVNGTNGIELDGGVAGDYPGSDAFVDGQGFMAVGDINGDGVADLILGGPLGTRNGLATSGAAFVVFGGGTMKDGTVWSTCVVSGGSAKCILNAAGLLNGTNGFEMDGAAASGEAGWQVAIGDVNGDGYNDMVISAPFITLSGLAHAGATYVVFGGPGPKSGGTWSSTPYNLTSAGLINGTNGVELDGITSVATYAGWGVALGDVNGDGISDIAIGAPNNTVSGTTLVGSVYVYFGRKSGWPSSAYSLGGL
jgi:prepilin-type N-terminal cleavage/methylation domain-containing protein